MCTAAAPGGFRATYERGISVGYTWGGGYTLRGMVAECAAIARARLRNNWKGSMQGLWGFRESLPHVLALRAVGRTRRSLTKGMQAELPRRL